MSGCVFAEFVGKSVKVVFRDGQTEKIARGILVQEERGFLKINGHCGTIVINEETILKVGLLKEAKE